MSRLSVVVGIAEYLAVKAELVIENSRNVRGERNAFQMG